MAKPKPKGDFTVDGKPFHGLRLAKTEDALKAILTALPAGSFLSTQELARRLGVNDSSVLRARDRLQGFTVAIGGKRLLGSKKSIREAEGILASHD